MSKTYANIANTNSWSVLINRVNDVLDTLATEIVTANNSSSGSLTVGNVAISGILAATALVANTIRGGTVGIPAPLSVNANLVMNSAFSIVSGPTQINSTSMTVGSNVIVNTSAIFIGNSTSNVIMGAMGIFVNQAFMNTSSVAVGNSTIYALVNSSCVWVGNTLVHSILTPDTIFLGNSSTNTTISSTGIAPGGIQSITFGDATANLTANVTMLKVANSISSANLEPTRLTIGSTTVNAVGVSTEGSVSLGNSSQNIVINSTAFAINGQVFVSATAGSFTTGDAKITIKTVADAGWVMMNDGTIGDAGSGGTARASADCLALFTLLWNNIPNTFAPVSGGRGGTAAVDWAAKKNISLTKVLGRALAIGGAGIGLTSRALGEAIGEERHTQLVAELAAHNHAVTDPTHTHGRTDPGHNHGHSDPAHTHSVADPTHSHYLPQVVTHSGGYYIRGDGAYFGEAGATSGAYSGIALYSAGTGMVNSAAVTGIAIQAANTGVSIQNTGTSTPFNVMQPTSFWNIMIKL